MANISQYRAVLDDMTKQRSRLEQRLIEVNAAISALNTLMPTPDSSNVSARHFVPVNLTGGKYSGMGVRWGVLCLLTEDASAPMSTADVAAALQAGGMTTKGKSFSANVSAVLSDMYRNRLEAISEEGGWVLTDKGRHAWEHIRTSRERQEGPQPQNLPDAPEQTEETVEEEALQTEGV